MYSSIDMIYSLILSGILLHISDEAGMNALDIRVQSGSPGIIPCLYDKKHKENRKYWCKGSHWVSCSILAYANKTGKYSLTDYPAQSIFTVQWKNLKTSDSGYYWCVVEIGGYGTRDDGYYLYLTVQSAPDVSVVSSSVSGHEGGDISVQCLFSSGYQNKVKQWCRYKDKRCYTERRTDTSQSSSVQISDDDGRRSFTVLMTGLRLTDSGWYFCSVGDLQAPVHLTVTEHKRTFTTIHLATTPSHSQTDTAMITDSKPETDIAETHPSLTAASETETHSSTDEQNKSDVILVMCLIMVLVLILILTLVAIFTWRLRKKPESCQIKEEHLNSTRNTSSSVDDNSVIYSSVITFRKAPSSSQHSDGEVIYSSVKQTPKAAGSE